MKWGHAFRRKLETVGRAAGLRVFAGSSRASSRSLAGGIFKSAQGRSSSDTLTYTKMETSSKIRVGLLVDSLEAPAWHQLMLSKVQSSNFAEVVLIVINNAASARRNRKSPSLAYLLHTLYGMIDARLWRTSPDAFATRDLGGLLAGVPIITVNPKQTKFSDYIEDADIERIKEFRLDVLVRLGFRILRGRILTAEVARCGVWSHHHGDNLVNRGGPAGFWEVFEGHEVTGSLLQILGEELDDGLILSRSFSATDKVSVVRNRNIFYWKTASLLARELKRLSECGPQSYLDSVRRANAELGYYSRRFYRTPRNLEFVRAAFWHFGRYAAFRIGKWFHIDQWQLMFDLSPELRTSLWRFKRITPPKDRFWADPHVIFQNGYYYIFIEELMYATNRGHISVLVMDEKGNYSPPVRVLERPHHVSYPFVFGYRGQFYMIPESVQTRTIDVYRCVEFPYRWEFHMTLMKDIRAVDSTLFENGGKWWLFANIAENEGASTWDEVFLFSADTPLTDQWKPHPRNPLWSDPRRSRPAGRLFMHNSEIYRPSQDCSVRYGYGLRINRVAKLTETEYEEKESSFVEPLWDKSLRGVHTFNREGMLTIMDLVERRSRWFPRWKATSRKRKG